MTTTPKRQSGKRRVKAWAIQKGGDIADKVFRSRSDAKVSFSLAIQDIRISAPHISERAIVFASKQYKIIPCTIHFALPAKDKQKGV